MDEYGMAVQDKDKHLAALENLVKKSKKGGKSGGGGKAEALPQRTPWDL